MDYVSVMAVMLMCTIYAQFEIRSGYRLPWLRFGVTFLSHSKQISCVNLAMTSSFQILPDSLYTSRSLIYDGMGRRFRGDIGKYTERKLNGLTEMTECWRHSKKIRVYNSNQFLQRYGTNSLHWMKGKLNDLYTDRFTKLFICSHTPSKEMKIWS